MKFAALFPAVLLLIAPPLRAGLDDCLDATCRVNAPDGSCGSGCACALGQGYVYVLTAGHVVGQARQVTCEFWRFGHQSAPIAAAVLARVENDGCDAALLAVPESSFGGVLPAVVPLAPADYALQPGEPIASVGCARGSWSTGWKGHVLGLEGGDLRFVPPPANGRSGSALFDARGQRIVGIVRARTLDDQVGIACNLRSLHAHLTASVQCGPEGCPTPVGPLRQWQIGPRGGIFRYQDGQGTSPSTSAPWPTLQVVPESAASGGDLGAIHEKLDRIAGLLERQSPPQSVPESQGETGGTPPVAPGGERLVAVERETATLKEGMGRLHAVVEQLAGDQTTLQERIESRIDKVRQEGAASAGEIARAYARDLVTEKLADGSLGWSTGKLIATSLGVSGPLGLAIALGAWLLARRLGRRLSDGEPLLVERLAERLRRETGEREAGGRGAGGRGAGSEGV